MADAVTTAILANGYRNLIARFTNFSDGTGETDVAKLDATSATYANDGALQGVYWRVIRVQYDIRNGGLRIRWDADTDQEMMVLDEEGDHDFRRAPIKVPAVAGSTGIIRFTTTGFMPNSGYDVTLHLLKGAPQS